MLRTVYRLIARLRRQPKLIRNNIALGAALTVTGLLTIFTFLSPFGVPAGNAIEANTATAPAFSTLFSNIKEHLPSWEDMKLESSQPAPTQVASTTQVMRVGEPTRAESLALPATTSPAVTPRTIRIATTSASTTLAE